VFGSPSAVALQDKQANMWKTEVTEKAVKFKERLDESVQSNKIRNPMQKKHHIKEFSLLKKSSDVRKGLNFFLQSGSIKLLFFYCMTDACLLYLFLLVFFF